MVQAGTVTSPGWSLSTQEGRQPSQGWSPDGAKPELRFGELVVVCQAMRERTHRGPKQQLFLSGPAEAYMIWSFAYKEVVTNWGQVK